MQNPTHKFRRSSIVFEKPGTLSEKFKTMKALTNIELNIFDENLYTCPTYQCLQKGAWDFFILFRSSVICKNQERSGFYTIIEIEFFPFLLLSQHLNKTKTIRSTFSRH